MLNKIVKIKFLLFFINLFFIVNLYPVRVNLMDLTNSTNWTLLLSLQNKYCQYKFRINPQKSYLFHEHEIENLSLESYGKFLKWTGKNRVIIDSEQDKDQISNKKFLGLKIKIKDLYGKFNLDKKIIDNISDFDYPKKDIEKFKENYICKIIDQYWKKINLNSYDYTTYLNNLSENECRYILGITKNNNSYLNLKIALKSNLNTIKLGLNSEYHFDKFIKFAHLLSKYAYIKIILLQFNKLKQDIQYNQAIEIKEIINTKLNQEKPIFDKKIFPLNISPPNNTDNNIENNVANNNVANNDKNKIRLLETIKLSILNRIVNLI